MAGYALKWWAMRYTDKALIKSNVVGPFASREAALACYRATHPFTGPDWRACTASEQIMTGYGADGPYSGLCWDDAKEGLRS